MLAKSNRLTRSQDFKNVFDHGQSGYNQILGLKAVKNNLTTSRFGIIISTKISKAAVIRNQIKRRIREIVKVELKKFNNSYDIVIIARPGIKECNFEAIKKNLLVYFKKFGLY